MRKLLLITLFYNCNKLELGILHDWELPVYKTMLLTLIDKKSKKNTTSIILNSIKGIYWIPMAYYDYLDKIGISFKEPLGIVEVNKNSLNYEGKE